MGATVCGAVVADGELELAGAVDPNHVGEQLEGVSVTEQMPDVDVGVDFTDVAAARDNILWSAGHGVHAVVGTTGFDDADTSHSVPRSRGATA